MSLDAFADAHPVLVWGVSYVAGFVVIGGSVCYWKGLWKLQKAASLEDPSAEDDPQVGLTKEPVDELFMAIHPQASKKQDTMGLAPRLSRTSTASMVMVPVSSIFSRLASTLEMKSSSSEDLARRCVICGAKDCSVPSHQTHVSRFVPEPSSTPHIATGLLSLRAVNSREKDDRMGRVLSSPSVQRAASLSYSDHHGSGGTMMMARSLNPHLVEIGGGLSVMGRHSEQGSFLSVEDVPDSPPYQHQDVPVPPPNLRQSVPELSGSLGASSPGLMRSSLPAVLGAGTGSDLQLEEVQEDLVNQLLSPLQGHGHHDHRGGTILPIPPILPSRGHGEEARSTDAGVPSVFGKLEEDDRMHVGRMPTVEKQSIKSRYSEESQIRDDALAGAHAAHLSALQARMRPSAGANLRALQVRMADRKKGRADLELQAAALEARGLGDEAEALRKAAAAEAEVDAAELRRAYTEGLKKQNTFVADDQETSRSRMQERIAANKKKKAEMEKTAEKLQAAGKSKEADQMRTAAAEQDRLQDSLYQTDGGGNAVANRMSTVSMASTGMGMGKTLSNASEAWTDGGGNASANRNSTASMASIDEVPGNRLTLT